MILLLAFFCPKRGEPEFFKPFFNTGGRIHDVTFQDPYDPPGPLRKVEKVLLKIFPYSSFIRTGAPILIIAPANRNRIRIATVDTKIAQRAFIFVIRNAHRAISIFSKNLHRTDLYAQAAIRKADTLRLFNFELYKKAHLYLL